MQELCRQRAASKKSDMTSGKVITIGDAEQVTESLDSVASSWYVLVKSNFLEHNIRHILLPTH